MLGLMGKKIGMTQTFDERGVLNGVTVIRVEPNVVIGERTQEKNGYSALILATASLKKKRQKKPYAGQFPPGIEPTARLREVRDFEKKCGVGEKLGVELFEGVGFVDIKGVSKGKGFQGVMKRHGFKGGPKSHGSKFHRAPGSTGSSAFPSRVFPGARMPGHMGADNVTVKNLRLVKIDRENSVLLVRGAVPGPRGGRVFVQKAVSR